MKIGILTQTLHSNYGGLLQAFATQKVLKKLGHDALTIDRKPWIMTRFLFSPRRIIRNSPKQIFEKALRRIRRTPLPARPESAARFIRENISTTEKISAQLPRRQLKKYHFDAFVVGSDQVWRREYMPAPRAVYFLNFCRDDETVRRVAFSASFGLDFWNFSPRDTKKFSALAKKFHAISVREDSGVELCEKFLGVHAEHLVDPTMLLGRAEYEKIIEDDEKRGFLEPRNKSTRRIFSYILDESVGKTYVEKIVSETLGATVERIMPTLKELVAGTPFPPVSAWLRGFRDADFVITDSFHGSVFSIIFNKPFISIGNATRGMARFNSLLKMFGLEERLLLVPEKISEDFGQKIRGIARVAPDWGTVNARLEREQQKARDFLKKALNG